MLDSVCLVKDFTSFNEEILTYGVCPHFEWLYIFSLLFFIL